MGAAAADVVLPNAMNLLLPRVLRCCCAGGDGAGRVLGGEGKRERVRPISCGLMDKKIIICVNEWRGEARCKGGGDE